MRNKYVLIKLLGIAGLIGTVLLYFVIYFIPSLKTINRSKRQLKDLNLKVSDYLKIENAFAFPNQAERAYIAENDRELKSKIPEVRDKQDFIRLFTEISNYIQKLAEKDGIPNLVLNSISQEMKVNAGTLASDPATLKELLNFSFQRLTQYEKENPPKPKEIGNTEKSGLALLVPGVQTQTVVLSFSGPLKNAMNFINHIPWGPYYLSEDKITVTTGNAFPFVLVFLKIYYIEKSPEKGVGVQP
ncbi:MAG: hypothetical protein ACM3SY_04565 [Candidatus Omnitrophota bacterium]